MGISQEALAERAGLHRTYVCDIERGARNLSLQSIERLAAALKISVSTLFDRDGKTASNFPADQSQLPSGVVDILCVEDQPDDAELTRRALQIAGIANRIHMVGDGAAALDYLFCRGEYAQRQPDDRPHIILLDLNLPKVSGLEVLRRIKTDPQTRSIPVIVLTVSGSDNDVAASKRLGAAAYIVKPVVFQNFSKVVQQLNLQWALLKPAAAPEV